MLYPMAAMVLLTLTVGVLALITRFSSVKKGEMKAGYFRTMEGFEVSERVQITTRHLNNQFEIPVLFYVVCTLHIVLDVTGTFGLGLAWAFVASRVVHSIIHLGRNNIMHRMRVYAFGVLLVVALWINLLVNAG